MYLNVICGTRLLVSILDRELCSVDRIMLKWPGKIKIWPGKDLEFYHVSSVRTLSKALINKIILSLIDYRINNYYWFLLNKNNNKFVWLWLYCRNLMFIFCSVPIVARRRCSIVVGTRHTVTSRVSNNTGSNTWPAALKHRQPTTRGAPLRPRPTCLRCCMRTLLPHRSGKPWRYNKAKLTPLTRYCIYMSESGPPTATLNLSHNDENFCQEKCS